MITRAAGNAATNVASVSRHQSIIFHRRGQSQNSSVDGQSDTDGLLGEKILGVTISRHQTGSFSFIPVSSDVTDCDFELPRTTFSASGVRPWRQSVAPPEVCASSEVGLVGVAGPTSLFPIEPIARPTRPKNIVLRSLDNEVELTSRNFTSMGDGKAGQVAESTSRGTSPAPSLQAIGQYAIHYRKLLL